MSKGIGNTTTTCCLPSRRPSCYMDSWLTVLSMSMSPFSPCPTVSSVSAYGLVFFFPLFFRSFRFFLFLFARRWCFPPSLFFWLLFSTVGHRFARIDRYKRPAVYRRPVPTTASYRKRVYKARCVGRPVDRDLLTRTFRINDQPPHRADMLDVMRF